MKRLPTIRIAAFCAVILILLAPVHAGPVTISLVPVGNAGNVADSASNSGVTGGAGSVTYSYNIGKYDVTNTQYAAFLNTVDPTGANTLGLYDSTNATGDQQGITWNGTSYVLNAGYANDPVVYVNWYSAARFTNWLTNGQGSGGTETGVYNLANLISGGSLPADHSALVGTGKKWFLPTQDEWYKAAYYKGGSTNAGYWSYPFKSSTAPTQNQIPGGSTSANFNNGVYATTQSSSLAPGQNYLTAVGAYTSALTAYGAYDMGGDVEQWNEATNATYPFPVRGSRGGAYRGNALSLEAANPSYEGPLYDSEVVGFRVAELPEPSSLLLFVLGAIGVWFASRRYKLNADSAVVGT